MPNIRGFDAPQDIGLRPSEAGYDAAQQAARRIGTFYNQVADAKASTGARIASTVRDVGDVVEKFETNREISKGAADGAQLVLNLNDKWNQISKNADPNDPSVAQNFREKVLEPEIEKFRGTFATERSNQWAEHFIDQYRTHMFEKTSADMSTLAGIAAKNNARIAVNSLASAVASDPSSLDFALDAVGHKIGGIADSSPNMSATTSAAVKSDLLQSAKETIVKSAVSAMIQKNPSLDLETVQKKYGDFINGAEMKMFQKAAQTQAKVDMLQTKQIETYQRQQEEHQADTAMSKVITDNMSVGPDGRPVIKPNALQQTLDIARKFPQAGPEKARAMINFIEAQQNKDLKAVDNPSVVQGLSDKLFDPENPTTTVDLMKARAKGQISDHTYTVMSGLVKEMQETPLKGPVYQETMKAAHDQLVVNVPGIPGKDTVGTTKYAQFIQSFVPQYIAKSRAGTLEPNALDINDPNSMISKAISPFKRSPAQRMQDYTSLAGGLGGTPAPRNDVMPAIPPPDQRPPGLYETPKGKMKWTGTGWVNP